MRTGGRPEVNEIWTFALCRYDFFDAVRVGVALDERAAPETRFSSLRGLRAAPVHRPIENGERLWDRTTSALG